ncbi:MAG: uroporphyrinogen decarboxylase, partial [Rothia mucilaginosa]
MHGGGADTKSRHELRFPSLLRKPSLGKSHHDIVSQKRPHKPVTLDTMSENQHTTPASENGPASAA